MAHNDVSIFSVMAQTGMGYVQAVHHLDQRRDLGYSMPLSVIGSRIQKQGWLSCSPTFQNGEHEETVVSFAFTHGDDLMYVFENGSTIRCSDCTIL